jgi:hypothetical protein
MFEGRVGEREGRTAIDVIKVRGLLENTLRESYWLLEFSLFKFCLVIEQNPIKVGDAADGGALE